MSFERLKITRQFLNALDDLGFENPTEIQLKAIPPVRSGQNVIGIAQTGTGKTAAYLLPLLQTLKFAQGSDPRCLILVPTKELALQVSSQIATLSKYCDLRHVSLYGGVGPTKQLEELSEGTDIIVATPGRFMDLYFRKGFITKKIKHLVLDEADRMMDMGFMPKLRNIQEVLPQKRQNLLFSATFPERVQSLSEEFLDFPVRIEVTPEVMAAVTVEQRVYFVPNFMTKLHLLLYLLKNDDSMSRVIVFVRTKEYAESIGKFLQRKLEDDVRMVHSNKGQNSRINAMNAFRNGELRVLVSTDVSSRGLDIPDVSHVVNFSIPKDHHDYIHRIGRTGRAFKTGLAFSFADPSEMWHLARIEELMQESIPRVEIPKEVEIETTPKEEKLDQAREIDKQRRRDDPTFKGAFHEKKSKVKGGRPSRSKSKKRRR